MDWLAIVGGAFTLAEKLLEVGLEAAGERAAELAALTKRHTTSLLARVTTFEQRQAATDAAADAGVDAKFPEEEPAPTATGPTG